MRIKRPGLVFVRSIISVWKKNFIVWVKNYSPCVDEMRWDREELKRLKEKINWTLGGQMPRFFFFLVMWCWQLRWGFQLRCWIINIFSM
jgi:hypothetical protein